MPDAKTERAKASADADDTKAARKSGKSSKKLAAAASGMAMHLTSEYLEPQNFSFLKLNKITYQNDEGMPALWEAAERTTRRGDVDAVFIVAKVINLRNDPEPKIMIISQYRPPTRAYCLEFPAGLVDEGEDAETAALRELREETGYFGEVNHVSPVLFVDPGMTNANLKFVSVLVDCDKAVNQNVRQLLDQDEHITVHLINKREFFRMMQYPQNIPGLEGVNVVVSGLLYSFALMTSASFA